MKLLIVPVTPFQQNCSVLVDEATGRAVAIDPGGDLDRIDAAVRQAGGTLQKVLLTHGHIDHCGQAGEFAKRHAVPLEGPHVDDRFQFERHGYFVADRLEHSGERPVFNRAVTLRDSWQGGGRR